MSDLFTRLEDYDRILRHWQASHVDYGGLLRPERLGCADWRSLTEIGSLPDVLDAAGFVLDAAVVRPLTELIARNALSLDRSTEYADALAELGRVVAARDASELCGPPPFDPYRRDPSELPQLRMGLAGAVEKLVGDLADIRRRAAQAVSGESDGDFLFHRDGNGWLVAGFGEKGHFSELRGFAVIHRLVRSPGKPVPMAELVGAPEAAKNDWHSRQPVLDQTAIREYRAKLAEYDADIQRANDEQDFTEAAVLENERAQVQEQLDQALNITGKSRDLNNPNDKLRPRLWGLIQRARKAIERSSPTIAKHFEHTLSCNDDAFTYHPGTEITWKIEP